MSFIPRFEKGLILKQQMLEALRDYPMDFVDTFFIERGDGIIAGMNVEVKNNRFTMSGGIAKIQGKIIFFTEKMELEACDATNYVYLKIDEEAHVDGDEYKIGIIQKNEADSSLFELFRYTRNAEMKVYSDEEWNEIIGKNISITNRIDRSHVLWSINGGSTLSPKYYDAFAKALLNSERATVKDTVFAYVCFNGISNSAVIQKYFGTNDIKNDRILELMRSRIAELGTSDREIRDTQPVKKEQTKIEVC